jgi:hypothetical protein
MKPNNDMEEKNLAEYDDFGEEEEFCYYTMSHLEPMYDDMVTLIKYVKMYLRDLEEALCNDLDTIMGTFSENDVLSSVKTLSNYINIVTNGTDAFKNKLEEVKNFANSYLHKSEEEQ